MKTTRLTSLIAAILLTAVSIASPALASSRPDSVPVSYDLDRGFVITADGGHSMCRVATFDESQAMKLRSPSDDLHILQPEKASKLEGPASTGLTIVLRGTAQLESFPAAKAAFIRAAETWEALVRTPITVLIDVDFGPKRFGQTYPTGVLGSTSSQFGSLAYTWSGIRTRLLAHSSSDAETALLNSLPSSSGVPTTEGNCTLVYIPSSVQRALGILNAVPNEATEQGDLGPPPAIGFNSGFPFDFDPTNGIDSNKFDFNATAVHEIGHALGFDSWVGAKEIFGDPIIVSTWDLFRFRPGVTTSSFTSAQRVTSSGGVQIQFSGGVNTGLSTGRPDGSGGDGWQASHWKERHLNGNQYIGIMDPAGDFGDKDQLTASDLATLDLIGYDVRGLVSFEDAVPTLVGNTLTISGTGLVANLVIASATVKLLDASGQTLTTLPATPLNISGSSREAVALSVPGLEGFLSATMAEVTLVDDKGNPSAPLRVDFSVADAGGPSITNLTYNGKKLAVTGSGFTAPVQLEVNGVITSVAVKVKKAGAKLNVKGTPAALGLVSGSNRVRFVSGGLHSNFVIVNN